MTDSLLPQDTGERSLWADTEVPDIDTPELAGSHQVDVLIVGGGFTGLSAALHLAQRGTTVTLLEAKNFGFGGSGRNAGLVNSGVWQTPEYVEQQLGKSAGERFNLALRDSPELVFKLIQQYGIDCDAQRSGTINIAHSASALAYLENRSRQMQDRGSGVQLLDGAQSESLSGSPLYCHGGILDPNAGTIQPLNYARGLARAAIDQDAKLFQQVPLRSLQRVGSQWQAKTPDALVTADKVIIATNAYSDEHCVGVQQSTLPIFIFHCATQPLDAEVAQGIVPQRHGIWDTRLLLTSSRIDGSNRLLMSSAGSLHGFPNKTRQDWMKRLRNRLYPQTRGVEWSYHWSGQVGLTSNKLLRIQELAPGLIAPAGYNGRGIGPGTVIGAQLADLLITNNRNDFPFPIQPLRREAWRVARAAYYEYGTLALQIIDRV
jgi:glycine/D-amino acid oxidase-like deaminating enzyme